MAKTWTWVLGVVLTIVGIWGYLTDSGSILGIFAVDGTHNLIHLVSGIVGILAALGGEKYSKTYLQVFGVIYALVFILGLFGGGQVLGLFVTNMADNILHLVIAAVALYGGFGKGKGMGMGMPASSAPPTV
ncbi:MAG: DUF4383 domain-containing protein [bacterium]|nr:DUF4383 domain-containing protein [bacterium]